MIKPLSKPMKIVHKPFVTKIIGYVLFLSFLICWSNVGAQHLDVEGNAKIRGLLNINHQIDTSSVYIGRNSGENVQTINLYNTFLGSDAGKHNTSGDNNSFLGEGTGFKNETGSNNVFIGRRAGYNNNGFGNSLFGSNAAPNNLKGSGNTIMGFNSGYFNQGSNNTMVGYNAGRWVSDTLATNNTFVGKGAGASTFGLPTVGSSNTFVGQNAGNIIGAGGENTFLGQDAGSANVDGDKNTFVGQGAGINNASGNHNTFMGEHSGDANTTGKDNTFVGQNSGAGNATGNHNTFLGNDAGRRNRFGSRNTCIGDSSNLSSAILNNAVALGYKAIVDADYKVRIGNDSITVIEGEVAFSANSDIRLKENIQVLSLGLKFINELNPVSYHRKANSADDLEMGLIAQELKALLNKHKMKNSGMVHQVGEGYMSVRYNDLFAPLIKAVQQLTMENEALNFENQDLRKAVINQEHRINLLEYKIGEMISKAAQKTFNQIEK